MKLEPKPVRVSYPLWRELRRLAIALSTVDRPVSARELVDDAVSQWLARREETRAA